MCASHVSPPAGAESRPIPWEMGFPVLLSHGYPPLTSSLPELALLPEANPSRGFVLPLPSPLGYPYSPWHPTSILASPNKYARSHPHLKKPSFSPSPFLPRYCHRSANLLEKVTCFSHHLCLPHHSLRHPGPCHGASSVSTQSCSRSSFIPLRGVSGPLMLCLLPPGSPLLPWLRDFWLFFVGS